MEADVWPAYSGEAARTLRERDWSATPLGPSEDWQQSLRSPVSLILESPLAMLVLWGPELIQIYNDSYRVILAGLHPHAMGQRTQECWPEVWQFNAPIYEAVFRGECRSFNDQRLTVLRTGRPEDAWFDLTYSPLRKEDDSVGGVLVTVVEVTERHRSEGALRESEELYRNLFNSIDEGVTTFEVLFDEQGRAVDWIILENNPALTRITGLPPSIVGKRASEVYSDLEPYWLETFGRVAKTGEPIRGENYVRELNRWFDFYAHKIGSEGSNKLVGVYNDVTERKRTDQALRESEERQRFLLVLSDTLRPVADASEIQSETTRLLGEHLGLDRCYYFETDYDSGEYIIHQDFRRGDLRSLAGRHRIEQWPEMTAALSRSEILVIDNYADSPDIPPAERPPTANLDIGAIIIVPLVKHGTLVACVSAIQTVPRRWTEKEASLVTEVAERTWAAVERARAEDALRASEENQRALLEGIPQMVWRSKNDGFWTWSSPQWQSFTGQQMEESTGRGWLDVLHPSDRPLALDAWARAQEAGTMEADYRIRHQGSGLYRYHHTRSVPIRNESGAVIEWLGTSTDIEDLKRAEAERQGIEEQFRLFVDNVHEYGLVQTDAEGMINNWNPGAERLFGFASAEIMGRNFALLMTAEDQIGSIFGTELAYVRQGHRSEDARWFIRKDGSKFWARWITEPIHDAAGQFVGLAKIMRDETERERTTAFTQNALTEKEALLKEVHHRVKNNLQVITSLLNLQADQIEDSQTLVAFDEARNRVAAISSIHELLYRSTTFAAIHLADYARAFAPTLLEFYGAQGRIDIAIVGDGVTLELERAVPYGLLLNELLSNALKHAFREREKGSIVISFAQRGTSGVVTVADDGIGMSSDLDFERANTLGLALVRNLAGQLRGGVLFQDAEPGTRVEVQFPIVNL